MNSDMNVERMGIDPDVIALVDSISRMLEAARGTPSEAAVARLIEWIAAPQYLTL